MAALVALAVESFGGLDVMFNNAGIGGAFGPITEQDVEEWDATFAVNMRSVFLGTKHAARAMIAGGHGGSIINTASIAGSSGGGGPQAYSATKAGVLSLTKTTSVELARIESGSTPCHRARSTPSCSTEAGPSSPTRGVSRSSPGPIEERPRRSPMWSPGSPRMSHVSSPARRCSPTAV